MVFFTIGNGVPYGVTVMNIFAFCILKLTEGSLAPVACLECKPVQCARAAECRTLPMWEKLDKLIDDYLESVTLKDLTHVQDGGDFVI